MAFIVRLRFLLAFYRRAVSCWRSIALRLIMVCRGVCRSFLRFVRLLAFYRRAVSCWLTIAVRLIMVRPGVCRSFLLVLLFL